MEVPLGSLFLYDERSASAVVRTSGECLAVLDEIMRGYADLAPKMTVLTVEVFEADRDAMRAWLSGAWSASEHTAVWKLFREKARLHEATQLHEFRLETRDDDEEAGEVSTSVGRSRVEAKVDVDRKRSTVWVDLDMVIAGGSKADPGLQLKLHTILATGGCRLAGAWTIRHAPQRMRAAFLHAEHYKVLPKPDASLVEKVEQYARYRATLVAHEKDGSRAPTTLETRVMKLAPGIHKPVELQGQGARRLLHEQGVPFPEGASAGFFTSPCLLVVTNTRPNLDMCEQYRGESVCHLAGRVMQVTAELFEGDAGELAVLLPDAEGKPDHEELRQKIHHLAVEGKARVLGEYHVGSRAGLPAWVGEGAPKEMPVGQKTNDDVPDDVVNGALETPKKSPLNHGLGLEMEVSGHDLKLGLIYSGGGSEPDEEGLENVVHTQQVLTMRPGMTRLAGVWRLPAEEGAGEPSSKARWLFLKVAPESFVEQLKASP